MDSKEVSVTKDRLIINPANDLPAGIDISVQIEPGAIKDLAGNPYTGITNKETWNFTVGEPRETIPPTVNSYSPKDGDKDVPVNQNLVLTFSEPVVKGQGKIRLNIGNTVEEIDISSPQVSVNQQSQVIINPDKDFPEQTIISVEIPAGVLKDVAGNNFAGIAKDNWTFTTAAPKDNTPPKALTLSPAKNETGVATDRNLQLVFDEDIQAGSGNITINQGSSEQTISITDGSVSISGKMLTINPPANFPEGQAIYVQIPEGVIEDKAGNKYAGISNTTDWLFTTITEKVLPLISSFTPAKGAENVSTQTSLVIVFNEKIKKDGVQLL